MTLRAVGKFRSTISPKTQETTGAVRVLLTWLALDAIPRSSLGHTVLMGAASGTKPDSLKIVSDLTSTLKGETHTPRAKPAW